jgi:hypothetical protein
MVIENNSFYETRQTTLTAENFLLGKHHLQKKAYERESHLQQAKFNDKLKLPGCP